MPRYPLIARRIIILRDGLIAGLALRLQEAVVQFALLKRTVALPCPLVFQTVQFVTLEI